MTDDGRAASDLSRKELYSGREVEGVRSELAALRSDYAELERTLDATPELRIPVALERIAVLYREGVLDDVEFEFAKRGIIEGDG